MKATYLINCVGCSGPDLAKLNAMIDGAIDITRETFLKHVDRDSLAVTAEGLGYAGHPRRGLTMAGDWHVSYHRSKWGGQRCYFFVNSAIEYVFI